MSSLDPMSTTLTSQQRLTDAEEVFDIVSYPLDGALLCSLDYLQQSSPKIQDLFVLLVALQVKSFIHIFSLLQQQDLKDNTLCKWVSRREDTQIWVMPLLIPKVGLLYGFSVGGYRYCVGDPFWIWVPKWLSCWR